jgi:beta-xylosidase
MKQLKKFGWLMPLLLIAAATKAQTFSNPILSGFYPNPIICKAGNDYHIVNSFFIHYPGLSIFIVKTSLTGSNQGIAGTIMMII